MVNLYKQKIDAIKDKFAEGKNIRKDILDIYQFRAPTLKSLNEFREIASDYFIKTSAVQNRGFIDKKFIKNEYKKLAKDLGWSKTRFKDEFSFAMKRVETLKDNLQIKENDKVADFPFAKEIEKVAKDKVEKNINSKGNIQKKQEAALSQQKQKELSR